MEIYLVTKDAETTPYRTLKEALEESQYCDSIQSLDVDSLKMKVLYDEDEISDYWISLYSQKAYDLCKGFVGKTVKQIIRTLENDKKFIGYEWDTIDVNDFVGIQILPPEDEVGCYYCELECEHFDEEPNEKNIKKHKVINCQLTSY